MQNVIKTITEHPEMFLIIAGVILLIILVLLVRKLFRKPKHNIEEYQDTIESDSNQESEELSENENKEEYKQNPDERSRQSHIEKYDEDDSVEDTREYRADELNEANDSEPLKDSQEDDDVSMQMHAKRREPREWEKQIEEPSEEKVGKHGMPLDYYISENKPVTPENYQYRHGMYEKKEDDELSPEDRTFERDPDEKEEFQKTVKELTASLNEVKLSQNHLENKLDEIGKMFALMQENISKNTSDILNKMKIRIEEFKNTNPFYNTSAINKYVRGLQGFDISRAIKENDINHLLCEEFIKSLYELYPEYITEFITNSNFDDESKIIKLNELLDSGNYLAANTVLKTIEYTIDIETYIYKFSKAFALKTRRKELSFEQILDKYK